MTDFQQSTSGKTPREDLRKMGTLPPGNNGGVVGQGLSDFLRTLFSLLDEFGVRFCVLHSWELLPDELSSDLDMAIHPLDKPTLLSIFARLQEGGYRPFQCFNYFTNAYYFVFFWFEGATLKTAAVDFISEHRRGGCILATGEELVEGRQRHREFWIPSPKVEFAYLLGKRAWKGGVRESGALRLKQLVERIGPIAAERIAAQIVPSNLSHGAAKACASGTIDSYLKNGRAMLRRTAYSRHPLRLIRYVAGECRRAIRRWFQPTGVHVCILGPTEAEKNSVIGSFVESFENCPAFRRSRLLNWRFEPLFPSGTTGSQTRALVKQPRGALTSVIYLSASVLDYLVRYSVIIRPLLARSAFLVFNGYFHDILAHPRRYRYKGPMWYAKFLCRAIPEPDIVILVESERNFVFARGNETSSHEYEHQRNGNREARFEKVRKVVVKTHGDSASTLRAISVTITEFMHQRFVRRFRGWSVVAR
jgi:hypothetical protein